MHATEATPTIADVTLSDGANIRLQRWHSENPVRMVVSHGNGLAIGGFRDFIAALAREFDVVAFDMRNHGASGPGPVPADPWLRFFKDIPEIYDHISRVFGEKPTHGAFHSLSSASALIAQGLDPRPWHSLTLFEPPVPAAPDPVLLDECDRLHQELIALTLRRRRHFDSPDRLKRTLSRVPTFAGIPDTALSALARAMLYRSEADPAAPWELVCPPELEARTFNIRPVCGYWDAIGKVETPVQVVLGTHMGHDMPTLIRSGTFLIRSFGFAARVLEGGSHLMQLQRPEKCTETVSRFVRTVRTGTNQTQSNGKG